MRIALSTISCQENRETKQREPWDARKTDIKGTLSEKTESVRALFEKTDKVGALFETGMSDLEKQGIWQRLQNVDRNDNWSRWSDCDHLLNSSCLKLFCVANEECNYFWQWLRQCPLRWTIRNIVTVKIISRAARSKKEAPDQVNLIQWSWWKLINDGGNIRSDFETFQHCWVR